MIRGRPLKLKDPKKVQDTVDGYFQECDDKKRPYTITGIALALDVSRVSLLNYEKNYDKNDERYSREVRTIIKRSKLRCQNYAEESLFMGKNVAGVIFNMYNNYDEWTNKSYQDVTSKGQQIGYAPLSKDETADLNNEIEDSC